MPRKPLTAEQKQALGERLALARAARKQKVNAPPKEETVSVTKSQLDEILAKIARFENQAPQTSNASFNAMGRPVGLTVKYPTESSYYPNPCADLLLEPALRRYGFQDNFILKFEVKGLDIETKWGTNYSEPEFKLTVYQRRYDDNGELSSKVIKRNVGIFYEDQHAIDRFARESGITVTEENKREIHDKVRYARFLNYLVSYFNPPKPNFGQKELETVVDGQVVVMTELSEIL